MIGGQILDAQVEVFRAEYRATFKDLTSIPPTATSVDLSHNSITNLTSGVFSRLPVCTLLVLRANEISVIDPGAFDGLLVLEILNFGFNPSLILRMKCYLL